MSQHQRLRSLGVSGELVQLLNVNWRITVPEGRAVTVKQRLAAPLRRLLKRLFGSQETFNSHVVQYVNAAHAIDHERTLILSQALAGLDQSVDTAMRFHEAIAARERRMNDAMHGMRAELEEVRTAVGVLQRARGEVRVQSPNLKAQIPDPRFQDPQPQSHDPLSTPHDQSTTQDMGSSYVGFEDQFRGSAEDIRRNLASYVPVFAGASDVLDIGCGRGEFLSLLRDHGVSARGIDLNASMVQVCREAGLHADTADALAWLRAQPDASLGGLFAAQVVEHLEPGYLTQLIETAATKLRPGSPIVLETINPACWYAFFESYIRDITHVRPLHPDTLKFLLVASGFQRVDIQFRAPYPEHEKLRQVHGGLPSDVAETLNANANKLNNLLFTHMDYAAVAYCL